VKREAATGDDCLLGATPGSDAVELGLQVAMFYRRPQAHCTSVVLIRRLLAGTLVIAGTYASPRDEMCGRREPAHVDPVLGDDDVNAQILETWHRHYLLDGRAKGPKGSLHLRVDRGHSGSVDLIEMKAQQEALGASSRGSTPIACGYQANIDVSALVGKAMRS
jgi:hypothetical protein